MTSPADELELIISSANPLVKRARQLATRRRARQRERQYLVEGERALLTVLDSGTKLAAIAIDHERQGDISPALVSRALESGARVVLMDPDIFSSVADAEHPQAVWGIAGIHDRPLPDNATVIVALDAVRDPGNLGTIIRTAAAAGVDGVALLPGCVDPYHPATVRASAGTIAITPIARAASLDALVSGHFREEHPPAVVVTDATADLDYRDLDWTQPMVLVAGNEAHGHSSETLAAATHAIRIPIAGGVESLNVSVATGILLFHLRDRRGGGK